MNAQVAEVVDVVSEFPDLQELSVKLAEMDVQFGQYVTLKSQALHSQAMR